MDGLHGEGAGCDTAPMDLRTALAAALALLALGVFAGWRGARPPNPHRGPRMMPWRFIMVLCAAGVMILLGQAALLAGWSPPAR